MQTLTDHNYERKHTVPIAKRACGLAGVYCPRCQVTEMVYVNGSVMMTEPPFMDVVCPDCGHKGKKIV